eukprot:3326665-Alexandrium_andersonii.AAC.1
MSAVSSAVHRFATRFGASGARERVVETKVRGRCAALDETLEIASGAFKAVFVIGRVATGATLG